MTEDAKSNPWFSDDNDYPPLCPECGSEMVIDGPLLAQYGCLSFVSGLTGELKRSKLCKGELRC